jgi:hypothetical protein
LTIAAQIQARGTDPSTWPTKRQSANGETSATLKLRLLLLLLAFALLLTTADVDLSPDWI